MLNVGKLREAIAGLDDSAPIRLDFNTPHDAIAEACDHMELAKIRPCPHTGELVIVINDEYHNEDEDKEYEEDVPDNCPHCGKPLSICEQDDGECYDCGKPFTEEDREA